jgi:hypothetical protein
MPNDARNSGYSRRQATLIERRRFFGLTLKWPESFTDASLTASMPGHQLRSDLRLSGGACDAATLSSLHRQLQFSD